MRGGGTSTDAVEVAIKVLEDREITNAGYGSNLAKDGVVECDAVIVDHHGQSGGVGAVAQIKNPICLARQVLEHSTRQLTLRRVPPNLLVAQGATEFASGVGMQVLPHDALISPAAKERWRKWRLDLKTAEDRERMRSNGSLSNTSGPPSSDMDFDPLEEQSQREKMRRTHTRALEAGVWNEAQPLSPPPSSDSLSIAGSSPHPSHHSLHSLRSHQSPRASPTSSKTTPDLTSDPDSAVYTDPQGPPGMMSLGSRNNSGMFPSISRKTMEANNHNLVTAFSSDGDVYMADGSRRPVNDLEKSRHSGWNDGSYNSSDDTSSTATAESLQLPSLTPSPEPEQMQTSGMTPTMDAFDIDTAQESEEDDTLVPQPGVDDADVLNDGAPQPIPNIPKGEDHVTDTVGAIAIDSFGNIACGASSGGIGMKHRGRIGPAALVGVGAAVVPVDPHDKNKTCVATVTSGTGEHMATTMAATVMADRLYHGLKRVKGGILEETHDDDALRNFIEMDFMGVYLDLGRWLSPRLLLTRCTTGHPSVRNSNSTGALGLLAVKRTKEGTFLYFAHNTDSFVRL